MPEKSLIVPAVSVNRRAATRIRHGHVWVYRSDLASEDRVPPGSMVLVQDEAGKFLGSALYSSSSQIALRMVGGERLGPGDLTTLVRQRLQAALGYRERVVCDSDAYRIAFSEADGLPGLIVDRYNDILSFQVLTQAMDGEEVRAALLQTLIEQLRPAAIVERVEARIRELEQLPPLEEGLRHGEKTSTTYSMNGVRFRFHALSGQKTGGFLDQRENYAAAAQYAHGEALDVFCYQGGFALHLARVCSQVTAVDSSRPALEVAEQNETLNAEALGGREVEWMEANAFDLLKDYATAGRQYDTIVLDPPAFAKSRRAVTTALRGYKELNLRALKMLRPGGVLVSCSCSFHLSEEEFMEMLRSAAFDARRSPKVIERRGQAKDHPVLLAVPETAYLKCMVLGV